MKRWLTIIMILASISSSFAQGFSFLKPPTLAVMDFEVSMSEVKDYSKEHYGQLISQALVTALVRQNASEQVRLPVEAQPSIGAPVYAGAASEKKAPASSERKYFPPIFKIYDKKYVEMALQANAYTSKDLYAMNANAYAFAQLDFVVLGNVYQTASYADGSPAIGFNVRVLNTKRAEELYSYIAIVDAELRELPFACARIAQLVMRDILNNHCAQFKIAEAPELKALTSAPADAKERAAQAAGKTYDYLLFWQPKQVTHDDATIVDSTDAHKRQVEKDTFYWALPGQYVLSVYNRTEQQLKTVQFTLSSGEIKHVTFDESHLKAQNVSVSISGILPSDSYAFEFKSQPQQERYRWEIDQPMRQPEGFTVKFVDGKAEIEGKQRGVKVEYRPGTSELVISEVSPAGYQVTATAAPPSGVGSVNGWWVVSSLLWTVSQPVPVELRGKKDVALKISDFKLQAKKAVVAPRLNKVTYLVEPGFGSSGVLFIDDKVNQSRLWWTDKEKVTVTSEYSQEDWDMFPTVTYTFAFEYTSPATKAKEIVSVSRTFQKAELEPGKDTIIVLNLEAIRAEQEAKRLAESQAKQTATVPAATVAAKPAQAASSAPAPAAYGQSASASATASAKPAAAAAPTLKTPMIQLGVGFGGGGLTCYEVAGSYPNEYEIEHTVSGTGFAINAALLFPVSASAAMGFGIITNIVTFDEDDVADADIDEDGLTGVAATINMAFGAPGSSTKALLDIGYGTGFSAGFGVSSKKPGSKAGFYLRAGLNFDGMPDLDEELWNDSTDEWEDFPARNTNFSVVVGLLLG